MKTILVKRRDLGLSQGDLADMIGVSHSLISRIETGSMKPSKYVAYKLESILGQDIETLLSEVYV